ncbi:MAG: DUF4249 family protein [Prolixibacteraceae bacterium]|jgi:hypothetical protein
MITRFLYPIIIVLLFAGCEEIYNPNIDSVQTQLVVESHVTNDPAQNYVKLSKTSDFYSTDSSEKVIGAKVSLVQVGGGEQEGIEGDIGYFTFPNTPEPGKTYLLRIQYENNNYESSQVLMPDLPTIDTLYTPHTINKQYVTDSYGSPQLVEDPGRNVSIDAPISENLKYYRFNYRAVLQWIYNPPAGGGFGPPPPSWFGWLSIFSISTFNIAGPKEFSVSEKIQNHPVLFLSYDSQQYLDSSQQSPSGWIVIIDEYGITKESYDFREKLNQQFAAEGSLFDPVITQVYGNIRCTNDKSKIVLGFFDLNSYRQYRYFLNLSIYDDRGIQRRLNRYPAIPYKGYLIGDRPSFWEYNY